MSHLSRLLAQAEKAKKKLTNEMRHLADQIDHLDLFIETARPKSRPKRKRRRMSKATRAKMAAAQKRRWREAKAAKKK